MNATSHQMRQTDGAATSAANWMSEGGFANAEALAGLLTPPAAQAKRRR